jgi:hypothetical protein
MKSNRKPTNFLLFSLTVVLTLVLSACNLPIPSTGSGTATESPVATASSQAVSSGVSCLVGTWQVSNYPEYVSSLTNALPSGSSGGFTISDHGSTGTIQMAFNADNTASFTADNFTESMSMDTAANGTMMDIPINITENGTSTSTYSVSGDQISFSNQVQGNFTYNYSMMGSPSALNGSLFGASGSVTVYQYQCLDANTLSLKVIAINRDLAPLKFSRVQ